MTAFFTILIIVGCLGLVLFVLVQNPKGGGLNSEFGSAVQLGGAKRATDILEKGTWGLAAGIALICLIQAKDVIPSTDAAGDEEVELGADVNKGTDDVPASGEGQPIDFGGNQ